MTTRQVKELIRWDPEAPNQIMEICDFMASRFAKHPVFEPASEHEIRSVFFECAPRLGKRALKCPNCNPLFNAAFGTCENHVFCIDVAHFCTSLALVAFEHWLLVNHDSPLSPIESGSPSE